MKQKSIITIAVLAALVVSVFFAVHDSASASVVSKRYKEYKAKYKNKEDKSDYFKIKALKKDNPKLYSSYRTVCDKNKENTKSLDAKMQKVCHQYFTYKGYKQYVHYRNKYKDRGDDDDDEIAAAATPEEPFVCGTSQVEDVDGNEYDTVEVNDQCWMAQNIMTTKYPDGTGITRGAAGGGWNGSDNGYYAYPPNTANNAEESLANIISSKLGFVYQWSAAMDGSTTAGAQGICPDGWHIPTDAEQYALENYLKDAGQTCSASRAGLWQCSTAGTKMKVGGSSNLDFPIAGYRLANGGFSDRNAYAYIFSSSQSDTSAWTRYLGTGDATVRRAAEAKATALSIRCLRD